MCLRMAKLFHLVSNFYSSSSPCLHGFSLQAPPDCKSLCSANGSTLLSFRFLNDSASLNDGSLSDRSPFFAPCSAFPFKRWSNRSEFLCRSSNDDKGSDQKQGEEKDDANFSSTSKQSTDPETVGVSFNISANLELDKSLEELLALLVSQDEDTTKMSGNKLAVLMNAITGNGLADFYEFNGDPVTNWTEEKVLSFLASFADVDSLANTFGSRPRKVDWNLERELREKVFNGSGFDVSYSEEYEEKPATRLFVGELKAPAALVYEEIKERMKAYFPELTPIFLEDNDGYSWMLVAYTDSLVRCIPNITVLQVIGFIGSLIFLNQVLYTDPTLVSGVSAAFSTSLFQVGFLSVLLSAIVGESVASLAYKLPLPNHIIGFLSPGIGTIGMCIRHKSFMPTRISRFDTALCNALFSLGVSIALILAPPVDFAVNFPSLKTFGFSEASGTLSGVVLVPANFLGHSALLSDLAVMVSDAVFPERGQEIMAIKPLALAGLLGLNFTAFNLLPIPLLNGGRIFFNIFTGDVFAVALGAFCVPLLGLLSFNLIWFFFILNIVFSLAFFEDDLPLNGHRSPDFFRSVLGVSLVFGAICTLLPPNIFGPVVIEILQNFN